MQDYKKPMTQYEEDIKYANNVLRVRNALHDGTLNSEHNIEKSQARIGDIHVYGLVDERRYNRLADIGNCINMPSIVSSKSLIHVSTINKALIDDIIFDIEAIYDEAKHFQYSLLYTPEVLKHLTVLNYLHEYPLPTVQNYFKIYLYCIPMLIFILDGIENGKVP